MKSGSASTLAAPGSRGPSPASNFTGMHFFATAAVSLAFRGRGGRGFPTSYLNEYTISIYLNKGVNCLIATL